MQTEIPILAGGQLPVAALPSQFASPERPPVTATAERRVDGELERTIQRLFAEHKAIGMAHVRVESGGSLTAAPIRGEIVAELHQKIGELAQRAIAQGHELTATLSSRHRKTLIVAPLPGIASDAVALVVDAPAAVESSQHVEFLSREVCLAAALMSLARCHEMDTQTENNAAPQTDSCNGSQVQSTGLLAKFRQGLSKIGTNGSHYAVGAILIIATGLIPWPHRVHCNVICEPEIRRFVAAPFDGKLLKSHVAPGDPVQQGQLLATLDGGDLRAQLASLQAKLDQAQQRRSAALSTGDGSKAEIERFEIQYLQSEIALLQTRTGGLEIRSPITGVIVGGDLERAEGAPLQVGENLFEIAPLDSLVAEIAIPEADVMYVADEMSASIKLDAAPGRTIDAVVSRIHPRGEIRDNASVFVAEATVGNLDTTLRPGMSGTAKIRAGRRPIGWLLFHRPYEAARTLIGW